MRPEVGRLARVRTVVDHLVRVFEESSAGIEIQEMKTVNRREIFR